MHSCPTGKIFKGGGNALGFHAHHTYIRFGDPSSSRQSPVLVESQALRKGAKAHSTLSTQQSRVDATLGGNV